MAMLAHPRLCHTERFAPSPTGPLHLGHAFSALMAHDAARAAGGRFLLRMEDLDGARVRPGYAAAIEADLAWLGIAWDGEVLCQSSRHAAYRAALQALAARGLLYACTCTRRDIAEAASAPQEGAAMGADGLAYPGTCREAGHPLADLAPGSALRLHMAQAVAALGGAEAVAQLGFPELGRGPEGEIGWRPLDPRALVGATGDVVLRRKDGAAAYHLAVVVDDAHQAVSHVTRGQDLFAATGVHRLLQALLGLPTPSYRHHRLIRDETGRRLAKRDDARALATLREAGWGPADVRAAVGLG